ncbi:helix-turn-helix domain-containing protein [Nocardia camponoti]|nr:helix-turn-helix transcriptional regulator [Nocardia camponoti]
MSTVDGARLRQLREQAGLSLTALATRVPYSRSALGHYETGARTPPPAVIDWYERVHAERAPRPTDDDTIDALFPIEAPLIAISHPRFGGRGYYCGFRIDGGLSGHVAASDAATAVRIALRAVGFELDRAS